MPKPTFLFHNFTGMRFQYEPNHPMLKNTQVSVLDENGNPYRPIKKLTVKRPAQTAQETAA